MNKELIAIIEDYVASRISDTEIQKNIKQDLIDSYETMQDFTEMDDGSFIMVTGNSKNELETWLSSEEAKDIIEKRTQINNHDKKHVKENKIPISYTKNKSKNEPERE